MSLAIRHILKLFCHRNCSNFYAVICGLRAEQVIARAQRRLVNSRNEIKTFVLQTDVNILVNNLYRFV